MKNYLNDFGYRFFREAGRPITREILPRFSAGYQTVLSGVYNIVKADNVESITIGNSRLLPLSI